MKFVRVLAAVAALSLTGAPRPGVRDVPSKLDDATFWQMVTEMSEPGGFFRSDNFISNESELQYLIPDLQGTVPQRRVYVGVGPEQNLTYIASLEPSIAFIVDIRRQNLVHHLMFKALMEMSEDRAQYVARLLSRPAPAMLDTMSTVAQIFEWFAMVPPDTLMFRATLGEMVDHLTLTRGFAIGEEDLESLRYIFAAFAEAGPEITYSFGAMGNMRFGGWMPTLREMMTETDERGVHRSYLATEANYRSVRQMQQRNLIVPLVGDFGGPKALRAVGEWLRRHDARIGVFYASNVEQYLFQDAAVAAAFYENLQSMPTDSLSTIVRSASSRGWVAQRNPNSRMAQLSMRIEPMLRAIREGRVANYMELVLLKP